MNMKRIKTGISELDEIIGGFPEGKTIIITGDPGSGKTIFGLQFAYTNCLEGKKILYVSTEEDAPELRQQGKSFGWNLEAIVKMRNTKTPVQLLPYEILSKGIIITIPIDSSD